MSKTILIVKLKIIEDRDVSNTCVIVGRQKDT